MMVSCFGNRQFLIQWQHQLLMNKNRILSGFVAVVYVIVAIALGGGEAAFKLGAFLVLPLACIWFADAMGGYTGPTMGAAITTPTPGLIVLILGWFLLLLPILVGLGRALFHGKS